MTDFNSVAKDWDAEPRRVAAAAAIGEAMIKNLRLNKTTHLLDYGVGTGLVMLKLQPFVGRIAAMDSSSGMLEVLSGKVKTAGICNVDTQLWDIGRNGIPSQKFDVIINSLALHHVQDIAGILKAFQEMLNPGGQIAIADLDEEEGDFHQDPQGIFHNGFKRESIEQLLAEAGFVSIRLKTAYTYRKISAKGIEKDYPIFLATAEKPKIE